MKVSQKGITTQNVTASNVTQVKKYAILLFFFQGSCQLPGTNSKRMLETAAP